MKNTYRVGYFDYRDDRQSVMNLHPSGQGRWQLITYRNTGSLPGVRSDEFKNFEDTARYVKQWEPREPLVSLGCKPITLGNFNSHEDRYSSFLIWLRDRGLFGALTLNRHCPFWADERGWTEKRASAAVTKRKIKALGVHMELAETRFPLRER